MLPTRCDYSHYRPIGAKRKPAAGLRSSCNSQHCRRLPHSRPLVTPKKDIQLTRRLNGKQNTKGSPRRQGQHYRLQHARLQGGRIQAPIRPLGASVSPTLPHRHTDCHSTPQYTSCKLTSFSQRCMEIPGPFHPLEPLPRHPSRPRHGDGPVRGLLRIRALFHGGRAPRRSTPLRKENRIKKQK